MATVSAEKRKQHRVRSRKKSQSEAWKRLRQKSVGEFLDELREYFDNVRAGADPIEAMSGHLCGPKCWHWPAIDTKRQARLRKAPWNQRRPR